MGDSQIAEYVSRLEAALGDEGSFVPIIEELRKSREVTTPDLVEIASKFVAPMAASSTKQSALERILKRHQNLMSFKRKQKAVGGRSAA
jgi:hypothetical protein